jgi:hypothetical protein
MANTTTDVKQIIVDIAQLGGTVDDLDNGSSLDDLNFNKNMCSDLCRQLNDYLQSHGSVNTFSNSDFYGGLTVQQMIDKVSKLL